MKQKTRAQRGLRRVPVFVFRQVDERRDTSAPARRQDPQPAALTAVLDNQGMVIGVLAGRSAARAFLREGQA